MTGMVGIFLGLVTGCLVADRRRATLVVVAPFLAILTLQTAGIAAGDAVSPPSTVTAWPGAVPYYVVQAVILTSALGIALQLGTLRARGAARVAPRLRVSGTTLAAVINATVCAAVVAGEELDRSSFDPGSVAHHTSSGSPPAFGVAGIALSVVLCAGLGCASLRRQHVRRDTNAV